MNNNNLTFNFDNNRHDGLDFTTNPNIGKVEATLYGVENNARVAIRKILRNNSKYLRMNSSTSDVPSLFLNNAYYGKAKTNMTKGDIYDEKIGRNLAHERCMTKYHKNFDSKIRLFLKDVRTLLGAVERYCDVNGIDTSSVPSVEEIRSKRFCEK